MGDFNPNSPSPLGMETRFYRNRRIPFPTNIVDLGMRIKPGALAAGILAGHFRLPKVKGAPGIVAEIVSSLAPAQTVSYFYPGSDTGSTTTNMQDQAGGALNFGDINNPFQQLNFGRNSIALQRATTAPAKAYFRGNNAGALAGRRILRVRLGIAIENRYTGASTITTNDPRVPITGQVVQGGITHVGNVRSVPKIDAYQRIQDLCDWPLSPNSQQPWTVSEVDNIISAANADTFGINIYGKADSQMIQVPGYWLEVTHCLENRLGFYYQRGHLRQGWDRYAYQSVLATAANTEYYSLVGTLTGSWIDFFSLAFMDPTLTSDIPSTGPTDASHDHRQGVGVALTAPGGTGRDSTTASIATDNEQMQSLFETTGSVINGESQPYGEFSSKDVYSGATANIGQQITSPGAGLPAAYSSIQFTVGWQDQTTQPIRPLDIEIRHGAGAISGGGTLDSTATLDPNNMPDGTFQDYIVRLNSSFVPAINTQYVVLFKSTAQNGMGYRFLRQDTRSDDILAGSGTTLAMVEGASQGGTTDSYVEAGAQLTRYDLGVMLIPPPAAPTLTATAVPATIDNDGENQRTTSPPYVLLTWTPSALTTSFGRYTVYRRRRTLPALPWIPVCQITVPVLGPTAAQVEANQREFRDYEAAWTPGLASNAFAIDGWDYAVTTFNTATGLESIVGASPGVALGVQVPPSPDDWQVSNGQPWLNWPLRTQKGVTSDVLAQPKVFPQVAGRDFALVRGQGTVPGRRYKLAWAYQDPGVGFSDEWPEFRGPRAAARQGVPIVVMRARGDRTIGIITEPAIDQMAGVGTKASADLYVTANESALCGGNFPAGVVLDGASNYINTPTTGLLDAPDGALTLVVCAVFANAGATRWALARANAGIGYGVQTTGAANTLSAFLNGTAGSGSVAYADPSWFDGRPHVFVITSTGTVQELYKDGVLAAKGVVNHGAITGNNLAMNFGARSDATANMALAPGSTWGMYRRHVTAAEALALSRYTLGHALQRVPPGPQAFYDLRDQRCWDGASANVYDLSGNGLTATMVASPIARGAPWPLADLDIGR